MIGLLVASSALHAEERRSTRGERLALAPPDGAAEVVRQLAAVSVPATNLVDGVVQLVEGLLSPGGLLR